MHIVTTFFKSLALMVLALIVAGCGGGGGGAEQEVSVPPVIYSVSISAEDGGSVDTSGGNFEAGSVLQVSATADEGFIFTQWSDGSTENPRQLSVDSDISITAEFLTSINLNLRVHLIKGDPWVHRSGTAMDSWVTPDDVRDQIIPELNSIWQVAGVVWEVEDVLEEAVVEYDGYLDDIKYIVDSERDDQLGQSDPNRLPLLYNLMQPSTRSVEEELDTNLFHIYIFPFIGNTSQGNAMRGFGWHSVVGSWSNKHNGGGLPEKTLLTESKSDFVRGSLSRTIAHELGHVLSLVHDCQGCLMYSSGYSFYQYQIDASREEALRRLDNNESSGFFPDYDLHPSH